MFKHITRLTARNNLTLKSTFTSTLKLHNTNLQLRTAFRSFTVFSQVGSDHLNLHKKEIPQHKSGMLSSFQVDIETIDPRKEAINASIPDYDVYGSDMARIKRVNIDHRDILNKHPLDIGAAEGRAKLEYTGKVASNQVMLFNLTPDMTYDKIQELCTVKNVQVMDIDIRKGIDGKSIAHAKVTVGSPRQVKQLKDGLYNKWIEDKKLKVKAKEDLAYETVNNRTIVLKDIPFTYKENELMELLKDYGTIVSLELPLKDMSLEPFIKDKTDGFREKRKEANEKEHRRAQQLIKESIMENDEYEAFLTSYLGEERAEALLNGYMKEGDNWLKTDQQQLLDQSRKLSISHLLTQLQSESSEVSHAKSILEKLKTQLETEEVPSLLSASLIEQVPQDEKSAIQQAVKYINRNREELDDDTLGSLNSLLSPTADPLEALQELSRKDLAQAYDNLIECLLHREELIKKRITEQVSHLGKDERILWEGKDWAREQEDVKDPLDPFNDKPKPEAFLSVSEQVRNVIMFKNIPPEIKLYQIVRKIYNPFEKVNFNRTQLAFLENEELNEEREFPRPNPNLPPSISRAIFEGAPLTREFQKYVDERVEELRDQFDLPFDELYHKEKKLIDQVVKAEQALKNKELLLESPLGKNKEFDVSEIPVDALEGTGFEKEHQFARDQRRHQEKLLKQKIDGSLGSGKFEYALNDASESRRLLDEGVITEREYDSFIKMRTDMNRVNLGYAFVTYSHTDEAKLALIMTHNANIDGAQSETFLKAKLDHSDMDPRYMLNKLKNDSELVDEMERLRQTKKELRDFESNLDSDLPSLKKLNQFRKLARDHVEDKKYDSRDGYARTAEEEEMVNEKLRKLQKENPDVDYTQLFDTERAEQIRRNQHKKALASYKAYSFLKHGIEFQGKTKQEKEIEKQPKNKLQSKDPYNFPPLQETVAKFLTKDKIPRILHKGETIERPGRRFGYSEEDFLEAYFGKDYAKLTTLEVDNESPYFGYNESMKKKYPIDKYLQLPVLNAQIEKVQQSLLEEKGRLIKGENPLNEFADNFDFEKYGDDNIEDTAHPRAPGRTLLNDLEYRVNNYLKRRKLEDEDISLINPREVQAIWHGLYEEYFPGEIPPQGIPKFRRGGGRREQKFEPTHEGEEASPSEQQPAQESVSIPESNTTVEQGETPQIPRTVVPTRSTYIPQREESYNIEFAEGSETYDPAVSSANKDFLYDYQQRRNTNNEFARDQLSLTAQRIENAAEQNDMDPLELYKAVEDSRYIHTEYEKKQGTFTQKQQYGMLQDEIRSRQKATKNLTDFARDSESEREDEDIYAHYMNQMKMAKQERAKENEKLDKNERLIQEKMEEMEKMMPEMPRFEGFFKSMSQGKHPFEEDQYRIDDQQAEQEAQHQADEEYDEELYERELRGRLMGEKLTPRQFETLFKSKFNEDLKLKWERDENREQYLSKRGTASILLEQMEALRRRKVLDGEWKEAESHKLLKEFLAEEQAKLPVTVQEHRRNQELQQHYMTLLKMQTPQTLFEKEYYFDEGLGETLKQHTENIKANQPDIEVQVRRDRDGYAIVKTLYKPKYKYDLDMIQNHDPTTSNAKVKESLDTVLQTLMPVGKDALTDFSKLDKQTLENSLKMFAPYKGVGEDNYELDEKSKDAMDRLIQERFTGKYKDDKEGFARAVMEFSDNATLDPTKKVQKPFRLNLNGIEDSDFLMDELEKEKQQMTQELTQQLVMKVKEHLFFKERKQTDFLRGRFSEDSLFQKQVDNYERSAQIMANENEDLLRAGDRGEEEGFDIEQYRQLKAEIKRRREAKERLLKQGFPELKPYVSI